MTIDLPDDVSPKVVEALEELVRRARAKFTGTLSYEFTQGAPVHAKLTVTRRLGHGESPSRLDVASVSP